LRFRHSRLASRARFDPKSYALDWHSNWLSAILDCNLNEEKAANTKLNTVALRKSVNAKASAAA
jgi:hypothetical protein